MLKGAYAAVMAGLATAFGRGAAALSNAGAKLQNTSVRGKSKFSPYTDRVGMPHGQSGDKLARKAMKGTVGMRHARGPLASWVNASVAKGYRHGRRR
jgi:hypothetical protein